MRSSGPVCRADECDACIPCDPSQSWQAPRLLALLPSRQFSCRTNRQCKINVYILERKKQGEEETYLLLFQNTNASADAKTTVVQPVRTTTTDSGIPGASAISLILLLKCLFEYLLLLLVMLLLNDWFFGNTCMPTNQGFAMMMMNEV
jgi:hypothetical protein